MGTHTSTVKHTGTCIFMPIMSHACTRLTNTSRTAVTKLLGTSLHKVLCCVRMIYCSIRDCVICTFPYAGATMFMGTHIIRCTT
ncbi:ORF0106L [giant sea perch iridovirus - K1]|uniref:ORF0106L n=1 Tax=Giant seaperch iridovirus TaxID=176655 RepID=A0A140GB88_GSIV|nr:ORF0106L [giant sea perch iridovirus - K1]